MLVWLLLALGSAFLILGVLMAIGRSHDGTAATTKIKLLGLELEISGVGQGVVVSAFGLAIVFLSAFVATKGFKNDGGTGYTASEQNSAVPDRNSFSPAPAQKPHPKVTFTIDTQFKGKTDGGLLDPDEEDYLKKITQCQGSSAEYSNPADANKEIENLKQCLGDRFEVTLVRHDEK